MDKVFCGPSDQWPSVYTFEGSVLWCRFTIKSSKGPVNAGFHFRARPQYPEEPEYKVGHIARQRHTYGHTVLTCQSYGGMVRQVNQQIRRLLARDRGDRDAAAAGGAGAGQGGGLKGGDKGDDGLRVLLALTKHAHEGTRVS